MAFTEKYANFDLATGANDGSSEADAWQTPAAVIANVAAGNRVNIKRQSSAYNLTSTLTFSTNGTATSPIYYRAYSSTIGDGGMWDVAYNSGSGAHLEFTGNYVFVEGIYFYEGATTNSDHFYVNGSGSWAIRCKAVVNDASALTNADRCHVIFKGGSAMTLGKNAADQGVARHCIFEQSGASSAVGLVSVDVFDCSRSLVGCIFIGDNSGDTDGLFINRADSGRGVWVSGCIFYGLESGIMIDEEPNAVLESVVIDRCIFDTMAAYGVERTNAEAGYVRIYGNYYRNCTTAFTNYSSEAEMLGNTALTADPFDNVSTDDYNLNSTAGGGAVLRSASFDMDPTDSGNTTFYPYNQWVVPSAGSGGGLLTHPGMTGGMRG